MAPPSRTVPVVAEREPSQQRDLTGIGEINALLGRGTRYEGKLAFEGRVRIDGQFRGEIYSDDVLILGEGAEVEATIEVGTLIVRGGSLRGRVHARRLIEIYPPGRVFGELKAPQIFIDKGVHFEGSCSMVEAPSSQVVEAAADASRGEPPPPEGRRPDAGGDGPGAVSSDGDSVASGPRERAHPQA
jgi:cytoskeletal protein CcmA (bactofilin family)